MSEILPLIAGIFLMGYIIYLFIPARYPKSIHHGVVQFLNVNRQYITKPWGGEDLWAKTDKYVGKVLEIKAGHQLSKQYHQFKDESLMVISGQMELFMRDDLVQITVVMNPGDRIHIPPGVIHRMKAVTDCRVVEVSTTELDDVVRLEDDYGRK